MAKKKMFEISNRPVIKPLSYDDLPKYKLSIEETDNGHAVEDQPDLKIPDFKLESERLKSFTNWTNDVVRPEDLAKAGFYFLAKPAHTDLVKCAFCRAEVCNWEPGDNPLDEHIKWSPSCPFAREQTKSNAPFVSNGESGQDVCGSTEVFPYSLTESETFRLLENLQKSYEDESLRLKTFDSWPRSETQTPQALVEAGFYYRGLEDHTICFSCSGALRDWKDDDDPWEQHALWFPSCKYVLEKKGQKYVEEVKRKLQPEVPSEAKEISSCEKGEGVLLCKICDVNERNVIFMPCKHILACEKCSAQFTKCPVCRGIIKEKTKVFLS